MRSLFASQGRVPAMGRTIRKPKTPDDHAGVSSPTPWPIPKEMRRAPSTHPASPQESPVKPRLPRRSGRNRAGSKQKQLLGDGEDDDDAEAAVVGADEALSPLSPVTKPSGVGFGAAGRDNAARGDADRNNTPRTGPRIDGQLKSTPPKPKNTTTETNRHEEIGGRVRSRSDGAWIAWSLLRPIQANIQTTGKAPVTVLCNGLSNDQFQWDGLLFGTERDARCLVRDNRALLRWDLLGHGNSGDPHDFRAVSIQSLADDLETVLLDVHRRGLADTTKITLVAYSLGCQVALEWCRTHAQYVKGAALVLGTVRHCMSSVFCGFNVFANVAARAMDAFPTVFAVAWRLLFTLTYWFSWYAHTLARVLGVLRVSYPEFKPFYAHLTRVHPGAYLKMLTSGQKHSALDVLALLDRREIPLLLVTGGKDVTVRKYAMEEMRRAAPRAQYVHVPNACHAGMVGERFLISQALEDFFRAEEETTSFNAKRLSLGLSPPRERYW